jgi:hypothetical protein
MNSTLLALAWSQLWQVTLLAVAVVVLPGGAFVVSGEEGDQIKTSSGASDSPPTGEQASGAVVAVSPAESNNDNGKANRLWTTYVVADVLDEIERTAGSRDEAKPASSTCLR